VAHQLAQYLIEALMADFSYRPMEMLKQLEPMRLTLPEATVKSFEAGIEKYKVWRRAALDDLLKIIEDDDDDESARTWSAVCSGLREDSAEFLEDNIKLDGDTSPGTHFLLTQMAREAKFFEALGNSNAAQVRDFLVHNRASLAKYTRTLDDKWRAIVENGNKLQSEEKKLHDEMLATTRKIVGEFVVADRTVKEKLAYMAQFPLLAAKSLADMAGNLFNLPDGMGEAAAEAARYLAEKNQAWLEGNQAFMGRIANYKALVQAEKGGVLPLFKETRREVYEYWERNKVDVARDWMARFRESLESRWLGQCPTPGQQEDGKDFYKAAFERMEKHFKAVEDVAREFEAKWTGVFKGPLAPKTIDELVDSPSWRVNAEDLVSIRTPEVVTEILEHMDGYYEESLEKPLKSLEDKLGDLPEAAKEEAKRAIALARSRVEEALRTRIQDLRRQVGESLRWFEPTEIQRALDRSELANGLE
jgi:hypothetical protein